MNGVRVYIRAKYEVDKKELEKGIFPRVTSDYLRARKEILLFEFAKDADAITINQELYVKDLSSEEKAYFRVPGTNGTCYIEIKGKDFIQTDEGKTLKENYFAPVTRKQFEKVKIR